METFVVMYRLLGKSVTSCAVDAEDKEDASQRVVTAFNSMDIYVKIIRVDFVTEKTKLPTKIITFKS